MIIPKHYKYLPRSRTAKRERTTLITSGKRNQSKEYTSLTSSGMCLKSAADASLSTMQPFTMRS